MYENITYALLLNRMLEKALSINNNLDTREGSLVWLGNAPAAVELQNLYIQLDTVLNETFADTASRDYLILRAAERPFPLCGHPRCAGTVHHANFFVLADEHPVFYWGFELLCFRRPGEWKV